MHDRLPGAASQVSNKGDIGEAAAYDLSLVLFQASLSSVEDALCAVCLTSWRFGTSILPSARGSSARRRAVNRAPAVEAPATPPTLPAK